MSNGMLEGVAVVEADRWGDAMQTWSFPDLGGVPLDRCGLGEADDSYGVLRFWSVGPLCYYCFPEKTSGASPGGATNYLAFAADKGGAPPGTTELVVEAPDDDAAPSTAPSRSTRRPWRPSTPRRAARGRREGALGTLKKSEGRAKSLFDAALGDDAAALAAALAGADARSAPRAALEAATGIAAAEPVWGAPFREMAALFDDEPRSRPWA
ncbi:hypothetical protein JL722_7929 [Aureococcus anophagefferens]|nr:hypothetical protein JL722_7929 [Aureococcus anophagefferens]